MKKEEIKKFKDRLEEEFAGLEKELKTVGRVNPDNPKDWEPVPEKMDILASDDNEVADNIEAFEENTAILKNLETRYNEVKNALDRIKNGDYGLCGVCKEPIEQERLSANPAAPTCKKHMA